MIRIMVMNGLLISLILIWTSAAKEPSAGYLIKSSTKPPTGPLNYSVSKPMVSLHETNKEILSRKFLCGSELGGVCVYKKKSCPSNLPSEKSPGKPYCSKKKHRCCYPDPTTAAPPTVVPTTTTTSEDVNWSDIRNACIKSNNYKTYQPLTLDNCKEKCVEEDAINCQSIEYSSAQQMCAISEARSDSDDFIEPCFVDGWVFAEIELNTGSTTGAPTTTAPSNTTTNGPTTGASTTTAPSNTTTNGPTTRAPTTTAPNNTSTNGPTTGAPTTTAPGNTTTNGPTTGPPTTTAPSNTTTNVTSCNLVWKYEEDRPLIMIWGGQTVVPPITDIDISNDPNRFPEKNYLIFACPGENNIFKHVDGNHTKLHGECISHDQFQVCVNNYSEIMDLSNLSCRSKMHPSIIKQVNDTSYKKSCEDIGGELYKIGYIYGDKKEFKDLDTKVCFSEKDQTTLWTSTNIEKIEISSSTRYEDPINFRTARGFAMKTFYSQKSQHELLKEVLDKEATSVWNDKACRNHGGHCVRGGKPCPKHLPHQTSQGEPFCSSFYRCCYSEQCDPTTCTYKGKKGKCSLDSLPGTTGVGSKECKKGCQCYIKDNKTLRQFESLQERMGNGEPKPKPSVKKRCDGEEESCDPTTCTYATEIGTCGLNSLPGTTEVGNQECKEGCKCYIKDESTCTSLQSQKERSNQRMMHIGRANPWHLNNQCGPRFPLQDGKPSQCNPQGGNPCCNENSGMCGSTPDHCVCNGCIDYRDCNLKWEAYVFIDGCWTYVGRAPLVVETNEDDTNTILTDRAKNGAILTFYCPGRQNAFKDKNYGPEVFECSHGKLITTIIGDEQIVLHNLGCVYVMKPSFIPILTGCGRGKNIGTMFNIEYEIINKPVIQVCFNEIQKTTLWTHHTIDGSNVKWHHGIDGNFKDVYGKWEVATGIDNYNEQNIGIDDIYSVKNQKRLNAIYRTQIDDGNVRLERGHMAAKADFVTPAEQLATLVFVNVMPQWKSINNGNWKQIESYTRWLAACLRENLKIYTGTYNVMTFHNVNTKIDEGIHLGKDENGNNIVPVPAITWKVVYTDTAGVAFVVYNYPEEPDTILEHKVDGNRCNELKWLYITPTRLNSRVHGRTYCFTITIFRDAFEDIGFPSLTTAAEEVLLTR